MRTHKRNGFGLAAWLCLAASSASAVDIYVDVNLTTGGDNGSTWANAYRGDDGLQQGLDRAEQTAGTDRIWVAQGTYKPTTGTDRNASIVIPPDTKIYGSFVNGASVILDRNELTHPSILDGDIGVAGDDSDNSYHVVRLRTADPTSRGNKISGFVIQNGNANDAGDVLDPNDVYQVIDSAGAGIYCADLHLPALERLIIRNNKALLAGAGLFNRPKSRLHLTNCRFENNEVTGPGGYGAGMAGIDLTYATLQNCVFYNNQCTGAGSLGGGLYLTADRSGDVNYVTSCTFSGNSAVGANVNGTMRYGHAMYTTEVVVVRNSISWANGGNGQAQFDSENGASDFAVTWSDIETGTWSEIEWNNIYPPEDPTFRDEEAGNLTLVPCSPCVDRGLRLYTFHGPTWTTYTPEIEKDNTDLDEDGDFGDPNDGGQIELTPWDVNDQRRLVVYFGSPPDPNTALDIGAFEGCPGDFDGDGFINLPDLANLLAVFGASNCEPNGCGRADFNCNGMVDLSDLAVLLARFGGNCLPSTPPAPLIGGALTIAVTPFDTGGYSGGGFSGEARHFVFDVMVTMADTGDDWIGGGVTLARANGAVFRLVPNASVPPVPTSATPQKYTTFFSQPSSVNANSRFNTPFSTGGIAGKHSAAAAAYTYSGTAIDAAWYDMAESSDGPAAVLRIVIDVFKVEGKNTSGGFGSVYFTAGSPGAGDIKVADMTFDVGHKYVDSGSTTLTGSFYVTD